MSVTLLPCIIVCTLYTLCIYMQHLLTDASNQGTIGFLMISWSDTDFTINQNFQVNPRNELEVEHMYHNYTPQTMTINSKNWRK